MDFLILAAQTTQTVSNPYITILGSFVGSLIGAGGILLVARLNTKTKMKELLIQTISEERIKWINSLRDEFIEFNKNLIMFREAVSDGQDYKDYNEETKRKYESLVNSIYRITLLLNPAEKYMNYLIEKVNVIVQVSSTLPGSHDLNAFYSDKNVMLDLQQIILKAEWKRVKKESNAGKDLKKTHIEKIYNDVAKAINPKIYEFVKDWEDIEKKISKGKYNNI